MNALPKFLYHGTSAAVLPSIMKHGIRPRGRDKHGNWGGSVKSHPGCVYLTTAYPLYFAQQAAQEGEDLAILELDVSVIAERLHADEDAIEQALRGHDGLSEKGWDLKRRTIYYRSRAHLYHASASLQTLGTCSHRGTLPYEAVTRVVVVEKEQALRLVLGGFDPCIMVENFRFVGQRYEQSVRWLFGDEARCILNPSLTREGIKVGLVSHGALSLSA